MKRNHFRRRSKRRRSGVATIEVVMTTVITFVIFGFTTYWTMRLSRVVFSVIGEMVGTPLL
jgi:hypothetical protein